MKRNGWRFARAVALAAIGLELIWLLSANLALAVRAFPRLIARHTNRLQIDYARAWSWYPGDLHLRGLSVRANSRVGLEFMATADRADARVSLLALAERAFRTTRLDADGVELRFRHRIDPAEVAERRDELALWPSIPGYPDVPLKELGPPPPLKKRPWRVELEGAALHHVRELWAMWGRLQGDGELRGRIAVTPHQQVELGPLELSMPRATVRVGDEVLARDVALRIGGELERYDPRQLHGPALLGKLTATIDARGRLQSTAPLAQFMALPLRARGGRFALQATAIRGELQPGSDARVRLGHATFHFGPARWSGAVAVRAHLARDGARDGDADLVGTLAFPKRPSRVRTRAHVRMRGDDLAGSQLRVDAPDGWWLEANLARGWLQLSPLRAQGELDARAPDARPILKLLSEVHDLPTLAADAFKLPGLRVHAEGRYAHGALTLAPVHVSGGHTIFDAAVRMSKHVDGAMLLHSGPAVVALDITRGKVAVAKLGGKEWFAQRLQDLSNKPRSARRARRR